ncbi:unnamed protein product [Parajaminaea phylloscopi]
MAIMSPETTQFVLNTVFPILGVVLANVMAFAPVPTFLHILQTGQLHPIDPMPIVIMFGSAIHTFAYAMAIKNPYMYASNGPAVPLVGFSLIALLRAQDLDPRKLRWLLFWTLGSITLLIVNIGIKDVVGFSWGAKWQGFTFNFYQYLFFSFPLSQVRTIVVNRDASPLVPLLVFAVTVNGALWSGYGIAIGNYFIAGPNVVATLVGVMQVVCIAIFGRKEAESLDRSDRGSTSSGNSAGEYRRVRTTEPVDGQEDAEVGTEADDGDADGDDDTPVGTQSDSKKHKEEQRLQRADKRQTTRRRKSTDLEAGV